VRMILDPLYRVYAVVGFRKVVGHLILLCLFALAVCPAADARAPLSKRHARAEALQFVAPIVDMLDVDQYNPTRMVPARDCRRLDRETVRCRFAAYYIAEGMTVRGWVRVQRLPNGLLGFLIPWDPFDVQTDTALRCGLNC
jgi:hypothetical protein